MVYMGEWVSEALYTQCVRGVGRRDLETSTDASPIYVNGNRELGMGANECHVNLWGSKPGRRYFKWW